MGEPKPLSASNSIPILKLIQLVQPLLQNRTTRKASSIPHRRRSLVIWSRRVANKSHEEEEDDAAADKRRIFVRGRAREEGEWSGF